MSFLGTELELGPVTLQMKEFGAALEVKFFFTDKAGKLHGHITHQNRVGDLPPDVQNALRDLQDGLRRWGRHVHFGIKSEDESRPLTIQGIADALDDTHDSTPQG